MISGKICQNQTETARNNILAMLDCFSRKCGALHHVQYTTHRHTTHISLQATALLAQKGPETANHADATHYNPFGCGRRVPDVMCPVMSTVDKPCQ
jgi:hypothetical protein